jgi:hypothetical protein
MNLFTSSCNPFSFYNSHALLAIKKHLEEELALIEGTLFLKKRKPLAHMKDSWKKSLELVKQEIDRR